MIPVAQLVQQLQYLTLGQPAMRHAQQAQSVGHPALQPCVDSTMTRSAEELMMCQVPFQMSYVTD